MHNCALAFKVGVVNQNPKHLLFTWLFSALGVIIAAGTSDGINYESYGTLLFAVLLLSVLNVLLKPLMVLMALPFVILTLGLGLWIINALLFMLVGAVIDGFVVASFWSALWGALWVSIGSGLANRFSGKGSSGQTKWRVRMGERTAGTSGHAGQAEPSSSSGEKRRGIASKDDDVIDI